MNKYFLVVFLIMIVAPAHAAWEKLDANLNKEETHFLDPETVRKDGLYRKVWVLSNYDEARAGGYRSVKTFYEFDCQQAKARSQTMLLYPDSMAQGEVIGAHHEESKEWFDFSSGSIFGQISDAVCTN
jgi:surface-adhesin protein E